MLVFNFRFFLLNVLIWSICMIGIEIRTVLNLELNGLHENVLEAEKLQKRRWPKYCGTPCILAVLVSVTYNIARQYDKSDLIKAWEPSASLAGTS